MSKSWFTIVNIADDTAEVRMYDFIGMGGISASQFCNQFNAIKAAKIDLRINSGGGEIADGTAICTAIKEHPAEVTAHVDGLAASTASWIATSCDKVQMTKGAFIMIHNPMNMAFGTAEDLRKAASTLDKMSDSIAQAYCDKTGKPKQEILDAMNAETWFSAQEAKDFGLVDMVKGEDDEEEDDEDYTNSTVGRAINSLAPLLITKFKNVPDRIKRLAAAAGITKQPTNEAPSMLKIINRDGKNVIVIEGKDHEVEVPKAENTLVQGAPLRPIGKTDEELAAAVNAATIKAKDEAIKEERAYRTMFNTVLASASLAGDAAAKFEKDFYGRNETDLKFLASHAIGSRATAVGEGSGNPENRAGENTDEKKAAAEITKYCTDRFAAEPSLRRQFHVNTANAADANYKAGLAKLIAVEIKSRADWQNKPRNQDDESGDDSISRLLKNKSVVGE